MKRLVLSLVGVLVCSMAVAQENSSINSQGITTLDPASIQRANRYALGKVVPLGARMLVTAGQVGRDTDGRLGDGIAKQADLAMRNLYDVVRAAGMDSENVLKVTIYYLNRADIGTIITARDKYFGEGFRPASTAIVVKSLASEGLLIEAEAIAAKVD